MIILLVALLLITLVAMVYGYFHYRELKRKLIQGEITEIPSVVEVDEECCGEHQTCEKDSLLAAVSRQIEYYDDEELDRFINHPADGYSEDEIEEFRDILYTCHSEEVAGWSRSLQLRHIELPNELKDELFLLIGERRGM
ncbi:MAG: phospholipase [Phocaeicola sp.]